MRKIVKSADLQSGTEKAPWLDVGAIAQVEVTSEDSQYPIESAFAEGNTGGWRASEQGKQTIKLFFDEPQQIRRIWLQFVEVGKERTQQFTLQWSKDKTDALRPLFQQQWNFSPEGSTREIEAAITRDRADHELRRRFGQSETARQRQAQEAAARRESELAAGHGEVRLAGFVTVTGRDEEDLRRACSQIHEHAARARIELHRLYGQQADAFTFTLPLCRGLR